MRELQKLLLPQLLEDRHIMEEQRARTEPSSPVEALSPRIPPRHPLRPSSGLSLSLAASPSLRSSSDTFTRRPLDVVEEDDSDMPDSTPLTEPDSDSTKYEQLLHSPISPMDWTLDDSEALRYMEYNLRDENLRRVDFSLSPLAKRQRADTLGSLASRMGSRMPSLKWKSRKASPTIAEPALSTASSLANSSRPPSMTSLCQLPPTPTRSLHNEDHTQAKPTTPLLPPIMTESAPEAVLHSPVPTPQMYSLPSPPLSSKPSNASIHHRPIPTSSCPLVPSSEIPSMLIDEPGLDKWADALGHSNFHILPEPYLPTILSSESRQQLQTDWDLARQNFAQHLAGVEHTAGPTSQIYRLSQEKWSEINAQWRSNMDVFAQSPCTSEPTPSPATSSPSEDTLRPAFSRNITPAEPLPEECRPTLSRKVTSPQLTAHHTPIHQLLQDPSPLINAGVISPTTLAPLSGAGYAPPPLELSRTSPAMPTFDAPGSDGKFPCVGDEGIVGPMERAPTPLGVAAGPRRKRKFSVLIRDWLMGARGHS